MRPMRPSKKRHSAAFIFILGIGIGISLTYACFDVLEIDFSKPSETPPAQAGPASPSAPVEPVEPVKPLEPAPAADLPEPPPPEPPAPTQPPKPDVADVEGLWPARHLFIGIEGTELSSETRDLIARFKPGGVVLRAENITDEFQTRQLVISVKEAAGLGLGISQGPLVAVAQEGGDSDALNPLRLDHAPFVRALSQKNNIKTIRERAGQYAEAALSRGIGVILGPVLDVYKADAAPEEWRNRTFADTPDGVFRLGIPFVQALCDKGAIAAPKYYPGVAAAKHKDGRVVIEEQEFANLAKLMYPFDAAAQAQTPGLIAGRVAVPLVDTLHPERPALQSSILVRDLVRTQMAYAGVILADDISSGPGLEADTPAKNTVLALAAGCDAVLLLQAPPDTVSGVCEAITQAIRQKPVALVKEELEKSKERLKGWNERLAQVDGRYPLSGSAAAEGEASAKVEGETPAKAEQETPTKVEGETPAKAEQETPAKVEGETPAKADDSASPDAEKVQDPSSRAGKKAAKSLKKTPEKTPESATAPVAEPAQPVQAPAVSILPPLPPAPPASPPTETSKPDASAAPATTPAASEAAPAVTASPAPVAASAPVETKEAATVAAEAAAPEPGKKKTAPPPNSVLLRHTIRRGESLASIAQKYDVRVPDLKAWNKLKDTDIKFGRRLRVYVPEGSAAAKKAQ